MNIDAYNLDSLCALVRNVYTDQIKHTARWFSA